MRKYILTLLLAAMTLAMSSNVLASKMSTGHEVIEFDPKISCLYAGKLYGPGSTVKQPTGLYICKLATDDSNKGHYQWVKVVGSQ